jgi:TBC1 domain family protein 5
LETLTERYTNHPRRWIRLLFGREFPFDDLLRVWDLLFAEDPSLELVDYICIAMLLRIRWQRMVVFSASLGITNMLNSNGSRH